MNTLLRRLTVCTMLALLLFAIEGATPNMGQNSSGVPLPQTIQFNRDIRPILSDNCFTCHGPDKTHRATVFHFDVEESAKQDIGGGRFAIVPGDPAKSLLIQRITSRTSPGGRMPPLSTGRTLSDRESRAADGMDPSGREVGEALVIQSSQAA